MYFPLTSVSAMILFDCDVNIGIVGNRCIQLSGNVEEGFKAVRFLECEMMRFCIRRFLRRDDILYIDITEAFDVHSHSSLPFSFCSQLS
jgi:hypothetical protein